MNEYFSLKFRWELLTKFLESKNYFRTFMRKSWFRRIKSNQMNAITIRVNKQMDGITFSIGPSIRELIKKMFPNAHPANNIFVGYDVYADFKSEVGRLEPYIYPALLGVDDKDDLNKLGEIEFIDTFTGKRIV